MATIIVILLSGWGLFAMLDHPSEPKPEAVILSTDPSSPEEQEAVASAFRT